MNSAYLPNKYWLFPTLLIFIFIILTLIIWMPSNFVRLQSFAVGEQFEAYHGALNIMRFGFIWAGVQDQATNPILQAHPFLYTHHANIGVYFSYLMFQLGIESLPMQNATSILGSAGGLLMALICIRRLTGCIPFSLLAMSLLTLDSELIRDWSVNIHRGLTYLSIFTAIWAFSEASKNKFRHLGWNIGALLSCLLLLGTDYLYFTFTFFFISSWVLLEAHESWKSRFWHVFSVATIFLIVFILRQLQVVYAVGWEAFSQEFVFQALNRLHLEFLYPGDLNKDAAEFYAKHQFLTTGLTLQSSPLVALTRFANDTGVALLYNLGISEPSQENIWLTVKLMGSAFASIAFLELIGWRLASQRISLLILVFATGVMVAGLVGRLVDDFNLAKIIGISVSFCLFIGTCFIWPKNRDINNEGVRRTILFGISALLGCIGIILVLPGYFLEWYWQFQLDSIFIGIWMAVALTPFIVAAWFDKRTFSLILVIFIIKLLSVIAQLLPLPPQGGDHTKALLKLRGETTASNFTPASTASYTHAFSGLIYPEGAGKLLSGEPVNRNDYRLLTDSTDSIKNPIYQMPKYFVFYKGLIIFKDDWSVLDQYEPIEEGNDYAIYSIPSKRKIISRELNNRNRFDWE